MQAFKKAMKNNDIVQVLKIPSFFNLMLSEFFSQLAFNMQHFVFIFLIYEATHSNTAVSAIILSFTIPAVLFSVLAGVFVDRWSKKKVLFYTNLLRGFLLLPFLVPDLHVGFILTLTFLIAVVTQFFLPAESAIIPLVVPKRLLVPANAVFAVGIYSTVLIGYIVSGPALLLLGEQWTIILLATLFFISTLVIFFVNLPTKKEKLLSRKKIVIQNVSKSFSREIHEVLQFIHKAKRLTRSLVIITLSQAIIFTFAALGPGYVATILDVQVENLSWILLAPAAVGMILGAMYLGSLGRKYKHSFFIGMGILISGIVFIFLPFGSKVASQGFVQTLNAFIPGGFFDLTILHIIVILAFIAGIANSMVYVPTNVSIQMMTSESIRGRVYGFLNAMVGAVSLLPVAVAGGLADIFGVARVITVMGIMLLLGGISILIQSR